MLYQITFVSPNKERIKIIPTCPEIFHDGKKAIFILVEPGVEHTGDPKSYWAHVTSVEEDMKNPSGHGEFFCKVNYGFGGNWGISCKEDLFHARFDNPEEAVIFYYLFKRSLELEKESCPLPDDVVKYIEVESQKAKEDYDRIRMQLNTNMVIRFHLKKLAEKYGLRNVKWQTGTCDADQEAEDLVNWKVDDEQTLIDYIYNNFGKDAGRSYVGHLASALRHSAPEIAERL
jgi:hypothetical protein